jgi:hypothetical protein
LDVRIEQVFVSVPDPIRIRILIHRILIHRIHMFLGLLDPDPKVSAVDLDPDPSIILLLSS